MRFEIATFICLSFCCFSFKVIDRSPQVRHKTADCRMTVAVEATDVDSDISFIWKTVIVFLTAIKDFCSTLIKPRTFRGGGDAPPEFFFHFPLKTVANTKQNF